jgi:hypothetical protein
MLAEGLRKVLEGGVQVGQGGDHRKRQNPPTLPSSLPSRDANAAIPAVQ